MLIPQSEPERNYEIKPGFDLNATVDEISRNFVQHALRRANGNLKETAELLGINYRSLRYLIEKLELKSVRETERRLSR